MRWSWPGSGGKPVYNFRSEGRRFAQGRCLIPADGFYEFTDPEPPAPKRAKKVRWLFTMAAKPWFCIAGLYRPQAADGARRLHHAHRRARARRGALPSTARSWCWRRTLGPPGLAAKPRSVCWLPCPAGTLQVERSA